MELKATIAEVKQPWLMVDLICLRDAYPSTKDTGHASKHNSIQYSSVTMPESRACG